MQLYNTLTKQKEEFKPVNDAINMYTCGPTVYNFAHIGNFRAYIFGDLLYRYLTSKFGKVKWVMNITDIDDKTIRDSKKEGDPMQNLKEFTAHYGQAFLDDMEKVLMPESEFHKISWATDHITQMQDLITDIFKNGYAYVRDGSVYFSLENYNKDQKYGKLVHIDPEQMMQGVRIDKDEYEREQISDFVLWKGRKDGEPYWEYELDGQQLPGRPGWHIECSAMEKEYFDLPFDIHTGGVDLMFPHHEDEIAQSCAGYKNEPTRFWCHNEWLLVDGEKMSKSKGNFYTLRDLEEKGIDLLDYRYLVNSIHYRSKMNFTWDSLEAAGQAREKIVNVMQIVNKTFERSDFGDIDICGEVNSARQQFVDAMDDDLNTPKAFAVLFDLVKSVHNALEKGKLNESSLKAIQEFFASVNDIVGIVGNVSELSASVPDEVMELAQKREEARKNKDFEAADAAREEIQKFGFDVRDSKDGPQIFPL